MKGDFSRRIFDAAKHYSGVLMQQGRVQLDTDWNEQHAIAQHRTTTEARDVIGACGAPRGAAGFGLRSDGERLSIGAGRMYVDGMLCENEADCDFNAQPSLPAPGDIRELLEKAGTSLGIAYLDVWQRHVTVLDDPRLRESALGGPDTTTRMQTIWQVRVLPVAEDDRGGATLRELLAERASLIEKQQELTQSLAALASQVQTLQLRLAALPPNAVQRRQLLIQIARVQAAIEQQQAQQKELAAGLRELDAKIAALRDRTTVGCGTAFKEWDALFTTSGSLNARTQPPTPPTDPCVLPPAAGYRRLENQLYRVEIHQPGEPGTASFKWSRDNGSVVSSIERISGNGVTVADLGPDDVLGFAPGQWVEISDDALELNGQPGQLAQIASINEATREITLLGAAPTPLDGGELGIDPVRHPKLRRWDFSGETASSTGVATSGEWQPLEDGIAVQFGQGSYRSGDFWLIPARTGTGEIEWPPYAVPNTAPEAQPPLGIGHHYCKLGLLRVEDGRLNLLTDCRLIFDPLTDQSAIPAMHIAALNWRNDDQFSITALVRDGLRITLDTAPDPLSVSDATVLVEIEMPYSASGQTDPNSQLLNRLVLRGSAAPDPNAPNVIVWRLNQQVQDSRVSLLSRAGATAATRAAAPANTYRLWVTLKGRHIWQQIGRRRVYLDGQVFGVPGLRRDGQPCSSVLLPSGDSEKASDFESWLYLGGEERATPLTVTRLRVLNGDIELGATDLPTTTPFNATAREPNVIEVTFSRAVNPAGFVANGQPQAMRLVLLSGNQEKQRYYGNLELKDNVARLFLQDPPVASRGTHRLTVSATQTNDMVPVVSADNGSALDGNYDGQPGSDFVFAFTID